MRHKAFEGPNQERIERLICEIEAAPTLLERLPQANRECVLSRLRAVQSIPASFASQERFACETCFPAQARVARDHKVQFEARQERAPGESNSLREKTSPHTKCLPKIARVPTEEDQRKDDHIGASGPSSHDDRPHIAHARDSELRPETFL